VAFKHAAPDHVVEYLVGEEPGLRVEQGQHASGVRRCLYRLQREQAIGHGRRADVAVQRHLQVFEQAPDRVELRGEQRAFLVEGRQQDTAQARVPRPADLGQRALDIVEADVGHPAEALRRDGDEIGEPPVVRGQAGRDLFRLAVVTDERLPDRRAELERPTEVGEEDLGRPAVAVHLGDAGVRIGIACQPGLLDDVMAPLVDLIGVEPVAEPFRVARPQAVPRVKHQEVVERFAKLLGQVGPVVVHLGHRVAV